MNKQLLTVFGVLLLLFGCSSQSDSDVYVLPEPDEEEMDGMEDEEMEDEDEDEEDNEDEEDDEDDEDSAGVEVNVGASAALNLSMESGNFFFNPNTIQATVGQEVVITMTNNGFHDFVIDELGVDHDLNAGVNTIRFTPTKVGTFEFYCSIGNHREQGMSGTITVS